MHYCHIFQVRYRETSSDEFSISVKLGCDQMSNTYRNNLIQKILEKSEADVWNEAVQEWAIDDCEEDTSLQSACICGKEDLRYLFTIRNIINENILFPIGSSCIKKFDRDDLNEKANIQEKLFKLLHAIENGNFITLSPEYFSRKLLRYLYDKDVFQANKYNNYDSKVDYEFMLKMFNKKDKDSITLNQQRKINAIIMASIRPYLVELLTNKII